MFYVYVFLELLRWFEGKESACQSSRHRRCGFDPWVGKIPWRRKWQPTSLAGHSPWGRKELDWTEQLTHARWGIGVTDNCFVSFLYVLNFL